MSVQWNDAAVKQIMDRIDQELGVIGKFLVSGMQQRAPVDTGQLRAGIHEVVDTRVHSVSVWIPAFYGIYQEFGTRFIKPHPFVRPTLLDASRHWRFSDVTINLYPAPQMSRPLQATMAGFRAPRGLTATQRRHVDINLRPVSRIYAKEFRRRRIKYNVIGPNR